MTQSRSDSKPACPPETPVNTRHGGRRDGAGRKPRFTEPTTSIRVPVSAVPMIRDWLDHGHKVQIPADPPMALARPLFGTSVSAGFPSPADDYVEGQLDLNAHFIRHPAATFFVRVTGDSMRDAGILAGDILIVDRALNAGHGSIVIAVVDQELTVKRLYRKDNRVELHPENPDYPVIRFAHDSALTIWGVVCGVTRRL